MGFFKGLSKGLSKTLGWIVEHHEEIESVAKTAKVGAEVVGSISRSCRKHNGDDAETAPVSTEEFNQICEALAEIADSIKEIEQTFETFDAAVETIQENSNRLDEEVKSLRTELRLHQENTKRGFVVMGVLATIGIVVAVILAIVL